MSEETAAAPARGDQVYATTRWISIVIVPVLVAAFVILYGFPDRTMQLWSWMVCPEMNALIMGGGYLSGAYFFTRVARTREWHRVSVGFVATTVFASMLMLVTILHWDRFNHDHVSFWAWLLLYASTPILLPVLWAKNQRTDPGRLTAGDVRIPRPLRTAVGIGGAIQLAFAAFMFLLPAAAAETWPWELDAATSRSAAAFVAFPAVTWLWFLFEDRWSSFRITTHVATMGMVLLGIAALRARQDFTSDGIWIGYLVSLLVGVGLNVALYVAMERRARQGNGNGPPPNEVPAALQPA
ncbi:MAG: hypothetical protein M3314_08195 [Actinomycetota bacterium]|nr:hypothetical protein [Actinomycetota bacterium]